MTKQNECRRDKRVEADNNTNSKICGNAEGRSFDVRRGVLIAVAVAAALTVILAAVAVQRDSENLISSAIDSDIWEVDPFVKPTAEQALAIPALTEPVVLPTNPPEEADDAAHIELSTESPAISNVDPPDDRVPSEKSGIFGDVKHTINQRGHQVIRTGTEDGTFAGALFIGDSRTVGFAEKSGVKATYLADIGIDVNRVLSPRFMIDGGEWKSLETLAAEGGYTKVYMSMGLNEMGWEVSESFISKYIVAASRVRGALPEAVIYVQGIIPITAEAAAGKYADWGENNKVREYNDLLRKMCAECGLIYLDVYSAFADENGCLPEIYSSDGVHLSAEGYAHWREYLASTS